MGRKKEPSPQAAPAPLDDSEVVDPNDPNQEYEVEEIVGHKIDDEEPEKVKYLYRVRWLGYTGSDDTWEPKESLEGGAEGILEEYINDRKNNGFIFFREGSRKSKVAKYLQEHKLDYSTVVEYDGGGDSDDELTEAELAKKKRKAQKAAQAKRAAAAAEEQRELEKERKRKKRESDAAAAAAANGGHDDEEMDEDARAAANYNKRHKRNSGSPLPIPASVSRGRDDRDKAKKDKVDKEKAVTAAVAAAESSASSSKKPSSKRSNDEQQQQTSKKRPSTAGASHDSDDDNEAVETSLKRSPLKEKKATDQRKSEEPPRSNNSSTHTSTAKKLADEPPKATPPLVSTIPISEEAQQDDEALLPLGSEVNAKLSSWEDLVTVESLEQSSQSASASQGEKEYKWLVRWNDELQAGGVKIASEEWIGNSLARKKFPQGLLSFYEDHLKFKSTPDDDAEEDGAVNGANDGNAMQQD